MRLSRLSLFVALITSVALLSSCGSTEEHETTITLEASGDGPFFAGPNSLTADYKVDLTSLIEGKSITADAIKEVGIKAVTVRIPAADSVEVDSFNNVGVQFVSDNAPMTSIAVLNPINGKGTEVSLTSSAEADVADFFKQESFTVLIDWDFKEDSWRAQLNSTVELTLNFKIKS